MEEEKPCISTIQQCVKASKNSHVAESGSEKEELIFQGKAITLYVHSYIYIQEKPFL